MKGPLAVMDHAAGCVKRGTLVPGKYINGCTAEADDAAKALRDAREEVAQLLEAARLVPKAARMKGPAGTTAYIISDEQMRALTDALAKFA